MEAPLRISRPLQLGSAQDGIKNWMDRLIKLIPSEIVMTYLAGRGFADANTGLWSLACLVLLLIVRIWGTHLPGQGAQWIAVSVSAVSFVIWVLAMGGEFLTLGVDPNVASLMVLVWTIVVPVIYKGD